MWCVVLDSFPLYLLGMAQASLHDAREAGFSGAEVYDSRHFSNLPWGNLVVLDGTFRTEQQARRAAARAGSQTRSARPHKCVPVKRGAAPLQSPDLCISTPPLADAGAKLKPGCFAWSPSERVAACVSGSSSMQQGSTWKVTFPGGTDTPLTIYSRRGQVLNEPPLQLEGKARATLAETIKTDAFYKLSSVPLEPPGSTAAPAYEVVATQKVEGQQQQESGSWDITRHRIVLKCESGKTLTLLDRTIEGSDNVGLKQIRPRGGRHVLFVISSSWAYEGETGSDTNAQLVDLEETCNPGK